MTCQELADFFELYALGVLEPAEKSEIDAHLARGCDNCQHALSAALALNAGVLSFVPAVRPRRRLKRRLLTSVGVHFEPHTPVSVLQWEASQKAASSLALRLYPMRIDSANAYEAAFAEAASAGITAVAASLSPTASSNAARIAGLAVRHRLPSIYARSLFVEAGGLMSYGPSFATDGRATARLVQRVLSGARPADLPVEQPNEFELIINTTTARQLGLTISSSLLLRANRVIGS